MKITVDRTKCEGYAKCVQVSPKVFQLDKTMIARSSTPRATAMKKFFLPQSSAQPRRLP